MSNGDTERKLLTKASYARWLGVSAAMVRKHELAGRLVLHEGMVDVAASDERIRSNADPARGGKGGYSPAARAPGLAALLSTSPEVIAASERAWAACADSEDDAPEPPGSSRTYFPAGNQFHEVADWVRDAVLLQLASAFDEAGTSRREAVQRAFATRLEGATGGLAQLIHQRVAQLLAAHLPVTPTEVPKP